MVFAVLEQRFRNGQLRRFRPLLALQLFVRHAQSVIKCPYPLNSGNLLDPGDAFRRHKLAAEIAFSDKFVIVVQLGQLRFKLFAQLFSLALAGNDCLQIFDHGLALDDLEAHANLVNAIVDRFHLGCLVDDVLRRRDLTAIV